MLGAGAVDFRLADGCEHGSRPREVDRWKDDNLGAGIGHPDVWPGVFVKDPSELAGELKRVCQEEPGGVARYSYEELRRFADLVRDRLRQSPKVGKIELIGPWTRPSISTTATGGSVHSAWTRRRSPASSPFATSTSRAERSSSSGRAWSSSPAASSCARPKSASRSSRPGAATLPTCATSSRSSADTKTRPACSTSARSRPTPSTRRRRFARAEPTTIGRHREHAREIPRPKGPEKAWTTRAITLAVRHVKGTQIAEFSRDIDATLAVARRGPCPKICASSAPATSRRWCAQDRAVRRLLHRSGHHRGLRGPALHGVAQCACWWPSRSRSPWP